MLIKYESLLKKRPFAQEGAYADVTVKVGVIKLLQKEFDLCEEAYVLHKL